MYVEVSNRLGRGAPSFPALFAGVHKALCLTDSPSFSLPSEPPLTELSPAQKHPARAAHPPRDLHSSTVFLHVLLPSEHGRNQRLLRAPPSPPGWSPCRATLPRNPRPRTGNGSHSRCGS